FGQQRLWFLDRLDPGRSAYNIAIVLGLSGAVDVRTFAAAFTRVTARHEVLRTTFAEEQGSPVQRIEPPRPFRLPVADLCGLADRPRGRAARGGGDAGSLRPRPRPLDPCAAGAARSGGARPGPHRPSHGDRQLVSRCPGARPERLLPRAGDG